MKKVLKCMVLIIVSMFIMTGVNAAALDSEQNKDISKGTKIIYLGRPTCGFCAAYKPGLDYLTEKYNINYIYVNTDVVSEAGQKAWFKKLGIDEKEFGTPTTVITEKGKVKETIPGFIPEEDLFDKLKEYGFINKEEVYVPLYNDLKYIDFNDYKGIVESDKKSIIVLAQHTCSACINAKSYINNLAKTLNIEINYFNLGFESQEEYDYFYGSYDYIKKQMDDQTLSTPTILVVKGKKLLARQVGFENEETLKSFIDDYYTKNNIQKDLQPPKNYIILIIVLVSLVFVVMLALTIKNQIAMQKMAKELVEAKKVTKKEQKEEIVKEEKKVKEKAKKPVTKKPTKKTTKKVVNKNVKK